MRQSYLLTEYYLMEEKKYFFFQVNYYLYICGIKQKK